MGSMLTCSHDGFPSNAGTKRKRNTSQVVGEDMLVLKRQIGKGGYGFVYEAEWNLARVAVKRPLGEGDLYIEEFGSFVM